MSIFKRKPKLPPIPRGPISTGEPSGQEQKQGDRMAIEVNGRLVWVDSSKITDTTERSEEQKKKDAQELASGVRQLLGLPEK